MKKTTKHTHRSRSNWNKRGMKWHPPILSGDEHRTSTKDILLVCAGFFLLLFIIAVMRQPADIAYDDIEQRELYPLTSTIRDI